MIGVSGLSFHRNFQKKILYKKALFCFVCLGILLVLSGVREANDIYNYVRTYTIEISLKREPLYGVLQLAFRQLGLSFYEFKAIVTFVCGILIIKGLKPYVENLMFIAFFYCFYLIFVDSAQFRNFIALSILVYSLKYVINLSQQKNALKYIICITVECGFHTAFLFYSVLLLLVIKGRRTFVKALFFIGMLVIGATYLNRNQIPFINYIMHFMEGNDRTIKYFSSTTKWGFLLPAILYFIQLVGIIWMVKNSAKKETGIDNKQAEFSKTIVLADLCCVIAIPLVMMNLTFYRLIRNLLLLNLGVFANAYMYEKKFLRRSFIVAFVSLLNFGWCVFEFVFYSSYDIAVFPVLQGEWFWK